MTSEVDMRLFCGLAIGMVLASAAGAYGQHTMFTTFGTGETFSATSPYVVGREIANTQVVAARCTTTVNGTIRGVRVALGPTAPAGSQVTLVAKILGHSQTTGLPTSTNDTMVPVSITLGGPQVVEFQSTRFLETFTGTTVWLSISLQEPVVSGRTVLWNKSPSATGPVAVSSNGAPFVLQSANAAMPAFTIVGEALNGACCNTATGQCLSTGHLACTQWEGFVYTPGVGCGPVGCVEACAADFDRSGTLAPADIFEFLNAWFAGCP